MNFKSCKAIELLSFENGSKIMKTDKSFEIFDGFVSCFEYVEVGCLFNHNLSEYDENSHHF